MTIQHHTDRTDSHRIAVLDPSEYEYVGYVYTGKAGVDEDGDDDLPESDPEAWEALDASTVTAVLTSRRCDVCGSPLLHVHVFRHVPTGDVIGVGGDCAQTLNLGSREELNLRNAQRIAARKSRRLSWERLFPRVAAKVAMWQDASEWYWRENDQRSDDEPYAHNPLTLGLGKGGVILSDVLFKLNRYGDISDRQTALVERIINRAVTRLYRQMIEAENEISAPAPSGRVEVVGEVLTERYDENAYGSTHKMLVRDDRGFKVWGTVPRAIDRDNFERGVRIRFTAVLTPSDDDPTFAFAKRPTKAERL